MISPKTENYEQIPIRHKVWLICDYCGIEFQRVKKSIPRLNNIINKDSCGSKKCTAQKKKELNLKKYGNENYFKSEEFLGKKIVSYFNNDEFKNKRKKTLLEKYGVESPLQNKEINAKQRATCKELYGVENIGQKEGFYEEVKKTNLEKYGKESPMQVDEFKEKRNKTCLEKYGAENYTQTEEYWDKRKKTCMERYGVEHPRQNNIIMNKTTETNLKKYGVKYYSQTAESKEKYKNTCIERYGVPSTLCLPENRVFGKQQEEIRQWLLSISFEFNTNYSILEGKEIDLYNDKLKFGIEFCGLYWHCIKNQKDKNSHFYKYKKCLEKGVRLLTIFSDEWELRESQCKNYIKSILGIVDKKIYARNCIIKELDKQTFNQFCDEYHIQGSNNLGIFYSGLVCKDELVGIMSLGRHHRYADQITLDRLCFKGGYHIAGGASKLFNFCKNKFNTTIVSWSDNRWSIGNVYKMMGFKLDKELLPDYSYVDLAHACLVRISKQSQKKSLTGCPKEITESQWATEHNLAKIYDCGKKRWLYHT